MRSVLSILFFMCLAAGLQAQNLERKMIIENGQFYYTTINDSSQVATLHTGKVTDAISAGKQYALPAGRNLMDPVNPLCWDVTENNVYAINFLDNPLNDRMEALKRIDRSSLKEWSAQPNLVELIMTSVDYNTFARNEPYQFTLKRSNVLSNFFFDGIAVNDSSYYMAITNNGELSIWHYNGTEWTHGEVTKFKTDNYFNLFLHRGKVHMLASNGVVYQASLNGLIAVSAKASPVAEGFIVENRDANTIKFMPNGKLADNLPLMEILEKNAVTIL